jgi:hypothetical protein
MFNLPVYARFTKGNGKDKTMPNNTKLATVINLGDICNRFVPTGDGSYKELRAFIRAWKECVNPKNTDDKCSFLATLCEPANHPDRTNYYQQYVNELNLDEIDFPVKHDTNDIARFEESNDIAVHVLGHDAPIVTHIRTSDLPRQRATDNHRER